MNNTKVKFVNFDSADVIATSLIFATGGTLKSFDIGYKAAQALEWSADYTATVVDIVDYGGNNEPKLSEAAYYQLLSVAQDSSIGAANTNGYTIYKLDVGRPVEETPVGSTVTTDILGWISSNLSQLIQ